MSRTSKISELIHRDPPAELNLRILAAASKQAGRNAFRQRIWSRVLWSAAAAAAAIVTVCGVWWYAPEAEKTAVSDRPLDRNELNALADWSGVEQENYNLSIRMNSGLDAIQEM